MNNLQGKTIIVTGGNSGVGASTAIILLIQKKKEK